MGALAQLRNPIFAVPRLAVALHVGDGEARKSWQLKKGLKM